MSKKNIIITAIVAVVITNIITLALTSFGAVLVDGLRVFKIDVSGVSVDQIEKYNDIKELLKQNYVDDVSDDEFMEGSIRGLAEAANDPYTEYMDKEEFESMQIQTNANYAGVGIVVGVDPKDNLIMISEVFDNSPAQKAQVHAGDKIIKVNETEVDGDIFEKAVSMIRGQKGTSVNLTLYRNDVEKPVVVNVTRDSIEIKTVKSKMLQDGIGYIRIIQFAEKTSDEFEENISSLKKEGMKKLVIDVRDNPGGILDQVVNICSQILPPGLVVYTVDKNGERKDYYSNGDGFDFPYVVLINERSASASEILAGAIKDYRKALLIGAKTYGKGVVQTVYNLVDGSGIKITTSKYYTPKGISIHKVGVKPDVEIQLSEDNKYQAVSKLEEKDDLQLQKAIETLK